LHDLVLQLLAKNENRRRTLYFKRSFLAKKFLVRLASLSIETHVRDIVAGFDVSTNKIAPGKGAEVLLSL
jgi:hypothetical protein